MGHSSVPGDGSYARGRRRCGGNLLVAGEHPEKHGLRRWVRDFLASRKTLRRTSKR